MPRLKTQTPVAHDVVPLGSLHKRTEMWVWFHESQIIDRRMIEKSRREHENYDFEEIRNDIHKHGVHKTMKEVEEEMKKKVVVWETDEFVKVFTVLWTAEGGRYKKHKM